MLIKRSELNCGPKWSYTCSRQNWSTTQGGFKPNLVTLHAGVAGSNKSLQFLTRVTWAKGQIRVWFELRFKSHLGAFSLGSGHSLFLCWAQNTHSRPTSPDSLTHPHPVGLKLTPYTFTVFYCFSWKLSDVHVIFKPNRLLTYYYYLQTVGRCAWNYRYILFLNQQ